MAGYISIGRFGDLSARQYTEFHVFATQRPDRPDWATSTSRNLEDQPLELIFYQDAESGLLVRDVEQFERWLERIPVWRAPND